MAASGSQAQPSTSANPVLTQVSPNTIPSDFRFKTIGQTPTLLRRFTTPDPAASVSPSPSPSPPASPKLGSPSPLIPDNQPQMKPKATLLQRLEGGPSAPPAQAPVAAQSQSSAPARSTRPNVLAEAKPLTAKASKKSTSLKAPSPDSNPNSAPKALPKLETSPDVPPPDTSMDVDEPVKSEPAPGQAPPAAADKGPVTSSSGPSKSDEPAASKKLADLGNRLGAFSEALLNLPPINTEGVEHLLELAKAQSTTALESANRAGEVTAKALECLQQAMKAVDDSTAAAQESNARTDAATAAVAALRPVFEAERQAFITPIQKELSEAQQIVSDMRDQLVKMREKRLALAQAAADAASAAGPSAAGGTSSAPAAVAIPPTAPSPWRSAPTTINIKRNTAQPTAPSATQLPVPDNDDTKNRAGTEKGKQKEERGDERDGADLFKALEAINQSFQEAQQRQHEAHKAMVANMITKWQQLHDGNTATVAQAEQATIPPSSSQLGDDSMRVDGDHELQNSQTQSQPVLSSGDRQRMAKQRREVERRTVQERLEAERQAAERQNVIVGRDMEVEVPTVAEEGKRQEEESRLRQAVQATHHRHAQQQLISPDEEKNSNAERLLLAQVPPISGTQDEFAAGGSDGVAGMTAGRQSGKAISGNVALGTAKENLGSKKKAKRTVADAGDDRNIRRNSSTSNTPNQSKPNSVSPTARFNPLPNDADYTMKDPQPSTGLDGHHLDQPFIGNALGISAPLSAGLPPRPPPIVLQHPAATQNAEVKQAHPTPHQQAAIPPPIKQQQIANVQDRVLVKREPDDDDVKPAQWGTGAPMTPDSLPPDNTTDTSARFQHAKREATIPMLSLPSPPPSGPPLAGPSQGIHQAIGQTHGVQYVTSPEQYHQIQATVLSGTQQRNDLEVPHAGVYQESIQGHSPTGFQPIALPRSPVPRISPLPEPVFGHRDSSPNYDIGPPVPQMVVTAATPAKVDANAFRGRPDNRDLGNVNSEWDDRNRLHPVRRSSRDPYSPSSPPPSRLRPGRAPPRGDHYSPRRRSPSFFRSPSPRPTYSNGYSRYPEERRRSRPPSAGGSRYSTPNPHLERDLPTEPSAMSRKRSYGSDVPQGPPPRRPRYDEPRDEYPPPAHMRTYSSSSQGMRDDRNVVPNRAPSPLPLAPQQRPRPLEERLEALDAPQQRSRPTNYDYNDRYPAYRDRSRSRSPAPGQRYVYDRRPLSPPPARRPPPPAYQEVARAAPAATSDATSRPDLLTRMNRPKVANNQDDDSYSQPPSNHRTHNANRGVARRGRGAGPTTPRGGKTSLINRLENPK